MKVVKEPKNYKKDVMTEKMVNFAGCDCDCDKVKVLVKGHR